jgi:hypothetical protein
MLVKWLHKLLSSSVRLKITLLLKLLSVKHIPDAFYPVRSFAEMCRFRFKFRWKLPDFSQVVLDFKAERES